MFICKEVKALWNIFQLFTNKSSSSVVELHIYRLHIASQTGTAADKRLNLSKLKKRLNLSKLKASPVFCCNPSNGSQDGANTGSETKFSVPACEVGFARYLDRDGGDCGHGRGDSEAQ